MLSYIKIERPDYLIPVIKDNELVWVKRLSLNTEIIEEVDHELKRSFDLVYRKLINYIDEYNLSLLQCESKYFLLEDMAGDLSNEVIKNCSIKESFEEEKETLDKLLAEVHSLFLSKLNIM